MRAKTWKALIVAALAVVILTAAVGGTMAWLSTQTQDLTNTFEPAKVTCAVNETFENNVKSNVSIKNTGTTDAYIRAMIVANWCTAKDANGKTKVVAPYAVNAVNFTDVSESGWVKHSDGFYYYTQSVAPGQTTGNLFTSCTPNDDEKPEGADHLEVNIICQAVQSTPAAAVGEAWKVTIAPNSVTAYSSTGN